jgi:hypothetical protein
MRRSHPQDGELLFLKQLLSSIPLSEPLNSFDPLIPDVLADLRRIDPSWDAYRVRTWLQHQRTNARSALELSAFPPRDDIADRQPRQCFSDAGQVGQRFPPAAGLSAIPGGSQVPPGVMAAGRWSSQGRSTISRCSGRSG